MKNVKKKKLENLKNLNLIEIEKSKLKAIKGGNSESLIIEEVIDM